MDRQIVRNSMITPDGTELISMHVHDYRQHEDKNGETYMVDGGTEYLRRSVNKIPAQDTSVYVGESHEKVREGGYWGSRGVNGDQPVVFKPIKDLDDDHIQALLVYPSFQKWRKELLMDEIEFRKTIK
jgi:hypothetical protein